MDYGTFSQIEQRVQQSPFADGKIGVISTSSGHLSGSQVAQLLGHFPHASDQVKALRVMQPRIWSLTCNDVKTILDKFSFASDKITALDIAVRSITDPGNKFVILDSFSFESDKEKARSLLEGSGGAGMPPQSTGGFPPPSGFPPSGGYPGQTYPPQSQSSAAYPPPTGGMFPGNPCADMSMAAGQAMGQMMGATMGTMNAMASGMQAGMMGYPPPAAGGFPPVGSSYPPPGGPPPPHGSAYPPGGSAYPPPPGSGYPPPY